MVGIRTLAASPAELPNHGAVRPPRYVDRACGPVRRALASPAVSITVFMRQEPGRLLQLRPLVGGPTDSLTGLVYVISAPTYARYSASADGGDVEADEV